MKKIVQHLRRTVYCFLGFFDRLFKRRTKHIVLCYHAIASDGWIHSVTPAAFQAQMQFLVDRGYRFVTLVGLMKTLSRADEDDLTATITFDDGYQSILTIDSVLNLYGIRPTVFVTNDPKKQDVPIEMRERQLLTENQLKKLTRIGWEIGYHSKNHKKLAQLTPRVLREQIALKDVSIKSVFTKPLSFAYPYGNYSNTVIKEVKNAGFSYGLTMDDRVLDQNVDLFRIPRIGVDGSHSLAEFSVIFSPSVIQLRALAKRLGLGVYFG